MQGSKLNNKAFSLVEVLIAMAILSTSLLVVLRAFSFSAKAVGVCLDITKAVFLAEDKLQELEFKRKLNLITKEPQEHKDREDKFEYRYVIKDEPDLNLLSRLEFEVSWKRSNESRSITLNTLLAH